MKRILLVFLLVVGPAFGQTPGAQMPASIPPSPPRPDPSLQALGQMVQEAQAREAQALAHAYSQQAQIADLTAQAAAEKKRADDAETKLAAVAKAP